MALIDLISEDVVKVPLVSTFKNDLIRELIQVLKDAGKVENADKVFESVMKREEMGSTGLEKGVAVPHAKTQEVQHLTVAIGIAPHGVDFSALDGNPSSLFFLLLAPPDQSGPHIEALAEIARLTRSDSFLRLILNSANPREVVQLFREE